MLSQYEDARDRNIQNAWSTPGGKARFEGRKVTDQRYLDWWRARRADVSDDDPMADYYDQMIANVQFQIREEKVTLAYTQGRIGEAGVARFYASEARKLPVNSSAWRDLMTNAAKFQQASKKAASGETAQHRFDRFKRQNDAIIANKEQPALVVQQIVNEMAQLGVGGVSSIWDLSITGQGQTDQVTGDPITGEAGNLQSILDDMSQDPEFKGRWQQDWLPRIRAADPAFHGTTLDMDYVARLLRRAKSGATDRIHLADRFGYDSYAASAKKDATADDNAAHQYKAWDPAVQIGEWYETARASGMMDPGASPQQREAARQTLIGHLIGARHRAAQRGDYEIGGALGEAIDTLSGATTGGQRAGPESGTFGSLFGTAALISSGADDRNIRDQAAQDHTDMEGLASGESVLVMDAEGNLSTVPRATAMADPKGAGIGTLITRQRGYTVHDKDGSTTQVGDTVVPIIHQGTPVVMQVGTDLDPQLDVYGNALAAPATQSGVVGYRYEINGVVWWQMYDNAGDLNWTKTSPFVAGDVQHQGLTQDKNTYLVTLDARPIVSGGPGNVETLPKTDATGQPLASGETQDWPRVRGSLTEAVTLTPEERRQRDQQRAESERKQAQQREGERVAAGTGAAGVIGAGLVGGGFRGWSEGQRYRFSQLSPENQRYLIDSGATNIPASEMTDEAVTEQRTTAPGRQTRTWWPPKAAATNPSEEARRKLSDLDSQLDTIGWDPQAGDTPEIRQRRENLIANRQSTIDDPANGFSGEVKALYEERRANAEAQGGSNATEAGRRRRARDTGRTGAQIQSEIDTKVGGTTGPQAGPPDVMQQNADIRAQIHDLEGLRAQSQASGGGLPPAEIDARIAALRQQEDRNIAASPGARAQMLGAALTNYDIGGINVIHNALVRGMRDNGATDGTVKVQPLPDVYTSLSTGIYSMDQESRKELAGIGRTQFTLNLMASDPALRDPFGARLGRALGEYDLIVTHANSDNSAYTADRITGDGTPAVIAEAATRNERQNGPRGGQRGIGAGGRPFIARPGAGGTGDVGEDPEAVASAGGPDAITTPDGPFVWGGGRQPLEPVGGGYVPSIITGDTDRPSLKLPQWGQAGAYAGLTAFQVAEQTRRREFAAATASQPVAFDSFARQPVQPDRRSTQRPQPHIKTPEPPPEAGAQTAPPTSAGAQTAPRSQGTAQPHTGPNVGFTNPPASDRSHAAEASQYYTSRTRARLTAI